MIFSKSWMPIGHSLNCFFSIAIVILLCTYKISARWVKNKIKNSFFNFVLPSRSLIYLKLVQGEWKTVTKAIHNDKLVLFVLKICCIFYCKDIILKAIHNYISRLGHKRIAAYSHRIHGMEFEASRGIYGIRRMDFKGHMSREFLEWRCNVGSRALVQPNGFEVSHRILRIK